MGGPVIPLGTVLDVKVGAHWTLAIALVAAAFFLGPGEGIVLAVALFASLLAHELAHALVARHCGVKVIGIELGALGGATRLDATTTASSEHEFAIAIAGPLASGAITIAAALGALVSDLSTLLLCIAGANAVVFVSNALPILPLDGGRALRALLAKRFGRVEATHLLAWSNRFVGAVAFTLGLALSMYYDKLLLGAPMLMVAVGVWMLGVVEVRRVEAESARASMGIAHYDAPWLPHR